MKSKFSTWQYWLLITVTVVSVIYALPNFYGEDPSVQISVKNNLAAVNHNQRQPADLLQANNLQTTIATISKQLIANNIEFKAIKADNQSILIRFFDTEAELVAKEILQDFLGNNYSVALNLAPASPAWLTIFGAKPMKLGLDLRGGVRFLMNVDVATVINADQELKHHGSAMQITEMKNSIMERTVATIRNRINELGVAEAIVQRHGVNNIVVELPGVQDTARAKDLLGKTASLHFVMVDDSNILGPKNRVVKDRFGRKMLVKKKVILTGDSIVWATSGFDPRDNSPVVSLRLGGDIKLFVTTTKNNIHKVMAIIYRETKPVNHNGVQSFVTDEQIISAATIRSGLGNQFQISGLGVAESRDLALLLRSGAMPASVSIVEEKIIGPSMGQENIQKGIFSVALGLALVLVAMVIYYNLFGLIANLALVLNLMLLLAGMSIIGATLTLPGIAGIVLTLGMAVDANVLIFERIKEEIQLGSSVLTSIHRGFDYALATIVDSNLTTLIVGIILFFVGSGPVKGFAVVLSIGILTSLFTAIMGTKAMVSCLYEGKYRLKKIRVGI